MRRTPLACLLFLLACAEGPDPASPVSGGADGTDGTSASDGTADGSDGTSASDGTADGSDGTAADGSDGTDGAADGSDGTLPDVSENAVADFSLEDMNPSSLTYGRPVSPRDTLEAVSGWYFVHAS